MARINLLPWRAERRKQRQREFTIMVAAAAILGVLAWFLLSSWYNAHIEGQVRRNAYLDQQVALLDTQISEIEELDRQRGRLLSRKDVIERLQADRSRMVHLFDSLVRTIPEGVVLTTLKQEGERLTLEGNAQSSARVSTYLRNLEGSGWMASPNLTVIEARRDGNVVPGLPYGFVLTVNLSSPTEAESEGVNLADTDASGGGQ